MSAAEAVVLGIVQGLTEFLPISSSGHLTLAQHFLRIAPGDLSFEVTVHAGTLIAVLIYFRQRLWQLIQGVLGYRVDEAGKVAARKTVLFLFIGTVPAVIVGLFLESGIERLFSSPGITAMMLIVTGIWLLALRYAPSGRGGVRLVSAFWVGIAQAAAILPGISRSGATIATGIMMGVKPAIAAEFSFLLSIPAVLGAGVLSLPGAVKSGSFGLAHWVGGITAAIVGYWALTLVFASLRRGRFSWFGAYCLIIGGAAGLWLLLAV